MKARKLFPTPSSVAATLAVLAALLTQFAAPSAFAAGPFYWDDNAAGTGFGTAGASTGTWAAPTAGPTAGWSTSATGANAFAAVTTATTDTSENFGTATATFGLGAGTITVSGTVSSGPIIFGSQSGAIALSGGTITLPAAATITLNNAADSISSILVGAGTSLTKAGTGALTLSGANTFSGATTISGGSLSVASLNYISSGTLSPNTSSSLGVPTTSANGTISIGSTTTAGTLLYTGTGETSDRVINLAGTTGGATIDQSGTGLLKFTSPLTATGAGAKTLTLQGSTAGTGEIGAAIVNSSSTTAVTKSGTGTWTLSGANTYTGATTVSAGELDISNWGAGTLGSITVTKGTLGISSATLGLGANSFAVGNTAGNVGIVNQVSGSVGGFTGANNGVLIGNGAATGNYNLSGGSLTTSGSSGNGLTLGVTLGVNINSTGNFTLSGTGTLTVNNTLSIGRSDAGGVPTTSGNFTQTGGSATVNIFNMGQYSTGTAGAGTACKLNLTGGTFTATAFNKLALGSSDNCSITVGGSAQVTLPAFPTTRGSGATATLTLDSTTGYLSPKAASATYISGLTHAYLTTNGANFNVPSGGFDITVPQILEDATSQAGTLTKSGLGKLTLSGANSYTGGTTNSAGTLALSGSGTLGATTGNLTLTGGTLDLGALTTPTVGAVSITGAGTIQNGTLTGTSYAASLASGTATVTATLAGSGVALTKSGAGTLALSGANTYSGNTTISAGTLALGNTNALQNSMLDTGTAGSQSVTFTVAGNNTYNIGALMGSQNLAIGANTISVGANLVDTTFSAIISGTGGNLTKVGANKLTLATSPTYDGLTTISAGTLALNNGITLASSVSIAAGATLDVSASSTFTLGSSASLTASGIGTGGTAAQIIAGGGATGINLGSRPVTLNFTPTTFTGDSANPALYVSSGVLNISGPITVNNNGSSPLGNGTYVLIQAANASTTGTPTLSGIVGGSGGLASGKSALIQRNGTTGNIELLVQDALTPTVVLTRHTGTVDNSTYGTALQFDASVSGSGATPTGTVQLRDGSPTGTLLASGTLSGGVITLAPALNAITAGAHTLYAAYLGDSLYGSGNASLAQTVTKKFLGINGATANYKLYDGTTAATISGASLNTSDLVTGDAGLVTVGTAATFDTAAVGIGKTVTPTLSGSAAGNYNPQTFTADILGSPTWANPAGGAWSTATNWYDSFTANTSTTTNDFSQVNLTSDATVHLDTTGIQMNSLIFGNLNGTPTENWVLDNNSTPANTLTLAGVTPTVAVNNLGTGKSATISAVVAGTQGLTKVGVGTLALAGTNSYTGGTTVSAGTLALSGSGTLGVTSGALTLSGGTLDLGALTPTVGAVSITAAAGSGDTIQNGTLTGTSYATSLTTGTATISAILAGSGVALTKGGNGTLALSGPNTYTGTTTINSGGLQYIGSGGSSGGGVISLAFSGGAGVSLTLNTSGEVKASQVSYASGHSQAEIVNLNAGTLTVGSSGISANGAAGAGGYGFNFGGGTLKSSAAFAIDSRIPIQINSAAVVDTTGGNITANGPFLAGTGTGNLTVQGGNTLILSGASTYTGNTTINSGTLLVNNTSGSGTGTGAVTVYTNGTLGGTGSIDGLVTNNAGGTLFAGANGVGTLTMNGNLVLNAGSTNTFVVNGTTLTASNSVTLGASVTYGGMLNIVPSGTFTTNQTFTLFSGAGATDPSNFGRIQGSPGAGLSFSFADGMLSVISTPPTLGTNTALTRHSGTVDNSTYGAALRFDVTVTGSGPTPTGTVELRDGSPAGTLLGSGLLAGGTAIIAPALNAMTAGAHILYGVYSGDNTYPYGYNTLTQTVVALPVTVTGASAGNKVFDGTTTATVTGGTVVTPVAGDTATEININGGTFANAGPGTGIGVTVVLGGTKASSYSLSPPPALTANIFAAAIWTNTPGGTWSKAGNWANSAVGTGTNVTADFNSINLTADTTVTNDTARTIGNLIFGDTDTSSAASWVVISNTITLAGTAPTITVNPLGSGATATINSLLTGTAGLRKNGTGTLILGGVNSYTGGLTVNNGTLIFPASLANTFTGGVTNNGGSLVISNMNSVGCAGGGNASSNSISLNGGTFSYGGGTLASDTLTFNLLNGTSTIDISGDAQTLRGGGAVTGSGNLVKTGLGTLCFGKNVITILGNTFTGNILVTGGQMDIRNPDSLGDVAGITTVSNATLYIDPFGQAFGVTFNAEPLVFLGNSYIRNYDQSATVAQVNTLTGPMTNNGTLSIFSQTSGAYAELDINGDLTNTASSSLVLGGVAIGNNGTTGPSTNGQIITINGVVSGPASVSAVGDSTSVYTLANNNYSGNTTVSGGKLKLGLANLATTSTVTVASGAILELDFGVANTVRSLILGGVTKPAGVYDSTTGAPYITGSGSLQVVSSAPPILNVANLGGGQFQFSWTGGGNLQAQTNSLSTGLRTNWFDYPGSSPVTITINPANGSVFYRVKQ